VVASYVAVLNDWLVALTTAVLVLGAWHRGRQSLGIARHYQRLAGGPVSPAHRWLLAAAVYVPMAAAVANYAATAPDYEGDPFHRLPLGPDALWWTGMAAASAVSLYLGWTVALTADPGARGRGPGAPAAAVHPGERWVVVANALAFASAYVLGAWTVSLVLLLAIHHEVQYLAFTYAMARQADGARGGGLGAEIGRLARFAVWPAIGLASWVACRATGSAALEPFLTAGLLGHYWLDGRIWTARARRLAAPADRP
jgi:hypothetical protein